MEVVVVEARHRERRGLGECTPYARYGESVRSVLAAVRGFGAEVRDDALEAEAVRRRLQERLPAGAARNALDSALWDLEARETGVDVRSRLGLGDPTPIPTFVTVGAGAPEAMAAEALRLACPRLKLKMTGHDDLDRVAAVREAVPSAELMLDANEAWSIGELERDLTRLVELEVSLIEQPLPADADGDLEALESPIPLCADESCHDRATLPHLVGRYDLVNVKLDKTGGLSEALALVEDARRLGLGIMVGCMLGTSRALAPALLLAEAADVVDLDPPLLLAKDRPGGLAIERGVIESWSRDLWGAG